MQLTRALYRNSVLFFAGFALLVIWGFWNSYYSNPLQFSDLLVHVHGFSMTLWCAMIVAQASLIRAGRRDLHRLVGRASYVLAPAVAVLMLSVAIVRIPAIPGFLSDGQFADRGYFLLTLTLIGPVLFAVFYGIAIVKRRDTAVHARLILCTVFPIAAAAGSRVMQNYFPGVVERLPSIAGSPAPQLVVWALADVLVLGLSIWDWVSHRRANVFPAVLVVLVAYHVFTASAHRIGWWRSFCDWVIGA